MTRCRLLSRGEQCTGEAVDPVGEILICHKHLARAVELLAAHGYTVLLPESSRRQAVRTELALASKEN